MVVLFVNFILFLSFVLYITRYTITIHSHGSISAGFMKQICDLDHCSESFLGIISSSVQQQPISVDCGVFAIAFVFDILNRFAETGKRFHVGKMRSHPLKCLEQEQLLFLRSHKHTKLSKGYIIYVDLYYICRSRFYENDHEGDENLFKSECAKCGEWYHKV